MSKRRIYRQDNRSNMKFREWLTVATHSVMTAALDIKRFTRPRSVGGRRTPETLADMTLGQMIALGMAKEERDAFYLPCTVLLGMERADVDAALAADVVRFAGWVCGRLDRINGLFKELAPSYSAAEIQAGVKRLQFGVFGMIDWYARRMGITNHEDVEAVPWSRVYECMKMDAQTAAYQRRLQKVLLRSRRNAKV